MPDVTQLLDAAAAGDPQAAADLLPLVYDELRKLAAARLADEKPGQTLQATALVHEAYLRLVGRTRASSGTAAATSSPPPPRPCAASSSRTPAASSPREAAGETPAGWSSTRPPRPPSRTSRADDLLALDEALRQFEAEEPLRARLVKLRYFAGLSVPEAAAALGVSAATAKRHWVYARAWLYGKVRSR